MSLDHKGIRAHELRLGVPTNTPYKLVANWLSLLLYPCQSVTVRTEILDNFFSAILP